MPATLISHSFKRDFSRVWILSKAGLPAGSCFQQCCTRFHSGSLSINAGRSGRSCLSATLRTRARSGTLLNGTLPVKSSQAVMAKLYTSAALSGGFPSSRSGAIQRNEPSGAVVDEMDTLLRPEDTWS